VNTVSIAKMFKKLDEIMLVKVKGFPASKKNRIVEKGKNAFQIYTKAKAEQGKANLSIKKMLVDYFNVSLSQVRLVQGSRQKNKIFNIQKIDANKEYRS